MGTSTLIDIMGAMIIGGMLMLNMMRVYTNTTEQSAQFVSEAAVQQNLIDFTSMLERDFLKIGYLKGAENLSHAAQAVKSAESRKIVFFSDIDNNGTQEEVEYSVGDTTALPSTENPHDRPFFRKINNVGGAVGSYGITVFLLEYFNYSGTKLATPVANKGEIATISVTVSCESPFFPDDPWERYNAKAYWKQVRLAIPNLRYK